MKTLQKFSSFAALQPWHLLRVPLLTITAHGFACVAVAFWVARDP